MPSETITLRFNTDERVTLSTRLVWESKDATLLQRLRAEFTAKRAQDVAASTGIHPAVFLARIAAHELGGEVLFIPATLETGDDVPDGAVV